jgi:hypothetical protein
MKTIHLFPSDAILIESISPARRIIGEIDFSRGGSWSGTDEDVAELAAALAETMMHGDYSDAVRAIDLRTALLQPA